jgi:hypothetical protein
MSALLAENATHMRPRKAAEASHCKPFLVPETEALLLPKTAVPFD